MAADRSAGDVVSRSGRARRPTLRTDVTDTVLEAVLAELADVGHGRLTMEGVARRAGSSKPTLYRRWASKEEMVLEAISTVSQPAIPPDTDGGSLLDHLRAVAQDVCDWLSEPAARRIVPDLLAEAVRNDSIGETLSVHVSQPRRAAVRAMLERAQARGEADPAADLEMVLDMLGALIYWRVCVLRLEAGAEYVAEVARIAHDQMLRPPGVR